MKMWQAIQFWLKVAKLTHLSEELAISLLLDEKLGASHFGMEKWWTRQIRLKAAKLTTLNEKVSIFEWKSSELDSLQWKSGKFATFE